MWRVQGQSERREGRGKANGSGKTTKIERDCSSSGHQAASHLTNDLAPSLFSVLTHTPTRRMAFIRGEQAAPSVATIRIQGREVLDHLQGAHVFATVKTGLSFTIKQAFCESSWGMQVVVVKNKRVWLNVSRCKSRLY